MKKNEFKLLLKSFLSCVALVFLSFCSKGDDLSGLNTNVILTGKSTDTIVEVLVEGDKVPMFISIPDLSRTDNQLPLPAVVVLHGSGGLWKDDDPDLGELSRQFEEWQAILNNNGYAAIFPDSYSGRGTDERKGEWKEPPKVFKISSEFVRPKDAHMANKVLTGLKDDSGNSIVDKSKIALLGFSHGGNSVAATLFDDSLAPDDWSWTQSFSGKEYGESSGVKTPVNKTEDVNFAAGIIFYGGSMGNGYWGKNPCDEDAPKENIYANKTPTLYQVPEDGYLTENTLCMIALLQEKGYPIESKIYSNVGHGFDDDGLKQSEEARANTLKFLNDKLK
ncbi:dienelactone hydrolase family protein [Muricauda sp. 2012CJ35-5]|uniref:Dienelactone hydrolase family protein n=1 Tax=Flagellimonas spongiicola TaxID=2942208 RepID=A0ABT0PTG4_9FLAO|nr:dienelactone hydrolase family protein [Allomuricauda spongiicola]MCL6274645.1 dienelactone hydrolase family protein [Allomuricauda spongiicola]